MNFLFTISFNLFFIEFTFSINFKRFLSNFVENNLTYIILKYTIYLSNFFPKGSCPSTSEKEIIMSSNFLQNNLRIWRDSDNGSLEFMIIQEGKGCVKHPYSASKEDVFDFMMPYIYELAYHEAYGKPYSKEYHDAVTFKNSLKSWLQSHIGHGNMTLTEARFILSELYLPTTDFSI